MTLKPLIPIAAKPTNGQLLVRLTNFEKMALSASPQGLALDCQRELACLLLELLRNGVHLSKSKLMWAFTTQDWYALQVELSKKSRGRSNVLIPLELMPYMRLLRQADAAHKAKELCRVSGEYMHSSTIFKAYQSAVECLHKVITKNPEIAQLLAPPICYGDDGNPQVNPNTIPRLHGHLPWPTSRRQPNLQKLTSDFFIAALVARLTEMKT